MKVEEAVVWLKRYQGYEPFENGSVLKHSFDLTDETVDAILSAISGANIGEALTLEQLREKVDEPVYLYIYDTALSSGWESLKAVTEDKIIFRGWNTVYVPISSLGKCFDLYAYPPARIDRWAWETCGACKDGKITIHVPEFRAMAVCNQHMDHEAFDLTLHLKFCPWCGRPLTEEAWDELEKRLRGVPNGQT